MGGLPARVVGMAGQARHGTPGSFDQRNSKLLQGLKNMDMDDSVRG